VLVALLGEHDASLPEGEFYDRLCAAVCGLTSLERSVLLMYDERYQAVRAVGSHNLDADVAKRLEGNLNETPVAQRALESDDIIVFSGDLREHVPERFREITESTVACIPVAASGRWLGVIFADCDEKDFELTESERLPLRTLGRAAALVAEVEQATREREHSHQLDQRIALTREIHEQVIQRLFGLSLVLGSEGDLAEADRARAHDELRAVLNELRGALERSLAPPQRETRVTLRRVVSRAAEADERIVVDWERGLRIPRRLEPLAQSVMAEALRNIHKHARPDEISITVSDREGALIVEVANDGAVSQPAAGVGGLGLRLASIEALQQEGVVEFGPLPEGRWRVRLVCPMSGSNGARG
jgi:signal transduction histidine kinase